MARTPIPTNIPPHNGSAVSFTASDQVNGNTMDNSGYNRLLMVRNTSGSPVNLTLGVPLLMDQDLKVPDRVISIPAATAGAPAYLVGPFDPNIYNQPDSTINLTASAALLYAVVAPQG